MKIEKRWKELQGIESGFIKIPYSIILGDTSEEKEERRCIITDKRRVATLVYLYLKTAMDYEIDFSLGMIVDWLGKKPDRHLGQNTVGNGLIECINAFKEMGWFEYKGNLNYGKITRAILDKEKYNKYFACERFAKIYVDEIKKIISYTPFGNDHRFDNTVLLLVFAYLRMMIPVRNNLSGVEYRIEAYDDFYKHIGLMIGLSERMVSKAVSILVDLGLIYELKRSKSVEKDEKKNKKKYFNHTSIFCNTYKRLKGGNGKTYLVAEGKDYYIKEAEDKELYLRKSGY